MPVIEYTYVDAQTRVPCTEAPMLNGPDAPVPVDFAFALESLWPTATPIMFGHVAVADANIPGVLAVLTDAEFAEAYEQEMTARRSKVSCTPRQARLALLSIGMLDHVDAAIASIEDETARAGAAIAWEYATEVNRLDPWVVQLGGALGMSDEQLDELFVAAGGL